MIIPPVREYLDSRMEQKPSTTKTMKLLEITQCNNYFEFGQKSSNRWEEKYRREKNAPSLCCLGASKLEEELIFPSEEFQSLVVKDNRTLDEADRFYGRFIDDMLALTIGTEAEAEEFVKWLNTLRPELKFTYKWSNKEITFLDVRLVMGEVWKQTGTSN